MRDISQELVILALFGLAWLIQWAVRFVRGRAVPPPVAAALPPPAAPAAVPSWPASVADAAVAPRLHPGARPGLPARAGGSKRFSRRALLGDRRTLQDAVVAAAILERCHAHRR